MGFEFTNTPPPQASAASAFKPLPSVEGTLQRMGRVEGPKVNIQHASLPADQRPLVFGPRPSREHVSDTADALSFFARSNTSSQRQIWDLEESPESAEAFGKYFSCGCERPSTARTIYCPSIAAHTIKHFSPDEVANSSPFRFLDLPAEMRNRVYRAALSPGYISLQSCAAHHLPIGVSPPLATGILSASKQLAQESKDLIMESTFIVDVSLDSGIRPVINLQQLPEQILPKIQHIVLVLDFTRDYMLSPLKADWRPVQKMSGLKTVKICAIQVEPPYAVFVAGESLQKQHRDTIKTILECIPLTCQVDYGCESDSKAISEHVHDMRSRIATLRDVSRLDLSKAEIVDASDLIATAEEIKEKTQKGIKNGSTVDYRYRS